jgi:F-type H+-transporting ATPase subunit delta
MAEPSTIARPYAEAVYRLAEAGGTFAQWSDTIGDLAKVAADPRIAAAINDPNIPTAKVAGMFLAVLAGRLSAEAENLVRVLAENRRLEMLPEIATQYDALKNEHEGTVEAEIVSAFPLDQVQLQTLVAHLESNTGKRVKPVVSVDSELIAGVRVVIGDKVIDGSARAQLAALEAALKR